MNLSPAPALAPAAPPVIACNLSARELAIRSDELRRQLVVAVTEIRELPDGYAFRFPAADDRPAQLVEFVSAERICCSFFRFELIFEPHLGPVWLHLRGADGVKEFVRQQLGDLERT